MRACFCKCGKVCMKRGDKCMEIMVSPCKEEQIPDCVRISVTSYEKIHDVYAALLGDEIHDGVMGSWRQNKAKTIEQQQKGKNAVVALADGTVAGFVSYAVINGVGHISNNAVDPAFRGLGIAGHLYTSALEGMKKDGVSYATVQTGLDDGHASARRAYQKVGFEKNLPYITLYQKLEKTMRTGDFEDAAVRILLFKEENLTECKAIALEAWTQIHAVYGERLGKEIHDGVMPNWEDALLKELEEQLRNQNGYVLLDGEQIIGFISYSVQENLGFVGYHAITSGYRNRGLGERMYQFVLAKMMEDGAEYAKLAVGLDDGHAAARRVCEKTGFLRGLPSVWYYRKL